MKKLLLVGCILLAGAATVYADEAAANFADLEATFQQLQQEEKDLYEAKKAEATEASQKNAQAKKMLAEVEAKEKQMKASSKSKINGDQYAELADRFKEIKAQLQEEIKANDAVIKEFNALSK